VRPSKGTYCLFDASPVTLVLASTYMNPATHLLLWESHPTTLPPSPKCPALFFAAPTVILDQVFDQQQGCPVPDAPSSSMLVWPLKGNYCLFDGQLGHGVLDSCSSSIRATLLVNWWTGCPQVRWRWCWVASGSASNLQLWVLPSSEARITAALLLELVALPASVVHRHIHNSRLVVQ
jgi:hypothetical protein